jgi:hypothetical protein
MITCCSRRLEVNHQRFSCQHPDTILCLCVESFWWRSPKTRTMQHVSRILCGMAWANTCAEAENE